MRRHHSALFHMMVAFHLINLGRGWWVLFLFQTMLAAGSWWVFHFVDHALPGGLVTERGLFYWCGPHNKILVF